ncbi:restriction endonuclease PLD domain-containing protein [Lederbergia citri]|uniref:NgoFVII family restriction endonuclease n=1 Tax=Lederbergia citri TaxID=2833580 RepID=A0A942TEE5_9BACI|nr:restriction endonuclease PLD domain-containing protein [Lederbergia citri]MBS4196451.1 NgoFVII family restriction endonuclease [Lederbergia citri]
MTIYDNDLIHAVIDSPYRKGNRHLSVVTGYASAPFILELLQKYKDLRLEVIVGMAKQDPIDVWTHKEFKRMVEKYDRLSIKYFVGERPIHSKIYYWYPTLDLPELIFVGSANLTRNGFINFQEVLAEVEMDNPMRRLQEKELVECIKENVEQYLTFSYANDQEEIDTNLLKTMAKGKEFVDLPLTELNSKDRKVHKKSGLNWGQRKGRNKNQAYIPVPLKIHKEMPDFFPARSERFTLLTDDAESFVCVMAQDNAKAIESSYDNSLIGHYFRKRLGLEPGAEVKIEHLDEYGRDAVRIYKINTETYYMDFAVPNTE